MKETRTLRRLCLAVAIAVLWTGIAAGSAHAGRPLITDDADTQGKGRALLEIGLDYSQNNASGLKAYRTTSMVELDYGLADSVDLITATAYQVIYLNNQGDKSLPQGMTDTLMELKWRFYEGEKGLKLAIKPGAFFPTGNYTRGTGGGDYRLGGGDVRPRLYFVATQEAGAFAFHFNLGYMRNFTRYRSQQDLWHASLAAEWSITKKLKIVGNTGIDTNLDKGTTEDPAFALAGIVYSLTEKIDLDFGVRYGLAEPGYDNGVTAGVSVKF